MEKAAFAAERLRGQGLEARIAAFGVERTDRMAALERRSAEISAMEAELAAARTEREALTATVAALEAERAERLAEIARRTEEIARLRAGALAEDGGAPVAANDAGDNMRKAIESIEAEKSSLEARLAALEADHAVVAHRECRPPAHGRERQRRPMRPTRRSASGSPKSRRTSSVSRSSSRRPPPATPRPRRSAATRAMAAPAFTP